MYLEVIERSATLPVDVAVLRKHARVPQNLEDDLYLHYLKSAVWIVEHDTQRSFVETKYEGYLNSFADDSCSVVGVRGLGIPRTPVKSVESVKYMPAEGNDWVTIDEADYLPDLKTDEPVIFEASADLWPQDLVRAGRGNIKVEFITKASAVDDDVNLAILELASGMIRARGGVTVDTYQAMPGWWSIDKLLARKRRVIL